MASDSVAGMAAPTFLVQMKVCTLSATTDIVLLLLLHSTSPLPPQSPSPLISPLSFASFHPFVSFLFSPTESPQVQEVPTHTQQMVSVRNINVEFSKETLETMLDGLGKIRDQLSSVAKTS